MSHTPHELHDEFPDDAEAIHALKQGNPHFAKLAGDYHTVNREIHRIESEVAPASDDALETLKKSRLKLVDDLAGLIRGQKKPA
jgi:uncharacterized protein